MNRVDLLALARRILTLPTAPYHEQHVRSAVLDFCAALPSVKINRDGAGNVIARYQHRASAPPLVFVAHMDHPAFEMLGENRAEFLGGVPREMFVRGGKIRVHDQSGQLRGKASIHQLLPDKKRKLVELDGAGSWRKGDFATWDLPAFRVANGLLHATAIDDVLGTTVMLATLAEISRRKLRAHVWFAFTRAEEVGFQGALALIRSRKIPRNALVVSIEMSKQRPWARIGDGPVVRIGDHATIFDPSATAFLLHAAKRCRDVDSTFRAQRCLMDGGSCEATAFAGYGYRVGGLCLPLGNYHNIGKNLRPKAEFVSVDDLEQLVQLTTTAAAEWQNFAPSDVALRRWLASVYQNAPRKLRKL